MINFQTFREMALAFHQTTEQPHFHKQSFKVGKKIFATYDPTNNQASLKLSKKDQDVFVKGEPNVIYPVPNKWGSQSWTIVNLDGIDEDLFADVLTTAYCNVAPECLSKEFRS